MNDSMQAAHPLTLSSLLLQSLLVEKTFSFLHLHQLGWILPFIFNLTRSLLIIPWADAIRTRLLSLTHSVISSSGSYWNEVMFMKASLLCKSCQKNTFLLKIDEHEND